MHVISDKPMTNLVILRPGQDSNATAGVLGLSTHWYEVVCFKEQTSQHKGATGDTSDLSRHRWHTGSLKYELCALDVLHTHYLRVRSTLFVFKAYDTATLNEVLAVYWRFFAPPSTCSPHH